MENTCTVHNHVKVVDRTRYFETATLWRASVIKSQSCTCHRTIVLILRASSFPFQILQERLKKNDRSPRRHDATYFQPNFLEFVSWILVAASHSAPNSSCVSRSLRHKGKIARPCNRRRSRARILVTRLCRLVCCSSKAGCDTLHARCVGLYLRKQVRAIRPSGTWIDCGWE